MEAFAGGRNDQSLKWLNSNATAGFQTVGCSILKQVATKNSRSLAYDSTMGLPNSLHGIPICHKSL